MIKVFNIRDKIPDGFTVVNVTSHSNDFGRALSLFLILNGQNPLELYGGMTAVNMENAWQYTKVYPEYADSDGNPTERYWTWAKAGFASSWANRYPNGKGSRPLYSLWDGERLDYIAARKKIYIPLYSKAAVNTLAFKRLKEMNDSGVDIALLDFDGYVTADDSYDTVVNDPAKKMGHAFVLKYMIESVRKQ